MGRVTSGSELKAFMVTCAAHDRGGTNSWVGKGCQSDQQPDAALHVE